MTAEHLVSIQQSQFDTDFYYCNLSNWHKKLSWLYLVFFDYVILVVFFISHGKLVYYQCSMINPYLCKTENRKQIFIERFKWISKFSTWVSIHVSSYFWTPSTSRLYLPVGLTSPYCSSIHMPPDDASPWPLKMSQLLGCWQMHRY